MKKFKRCNELIQEDEKYIAACQHIASYPLVVKKAKGCMIEDLDGNKFIDFVSSASSLNIGSSHPTVIREIKKQLRKTAQYTTVYSYNQPSVEYAKALAEIFPGNNEVKVCFGHSGSDSNDAAIKFARAYTGRKNILTFKNSYHGTTYGAASLTSLEKGFHKQIQPVLPFVFRVQFYESGKYNKQLEELEAEICSLVDPETIAAVIIEPVQGDSGMTPADNSFMHHLYSLCRKYGILFFSEEVQQGFYRTGKCFSIENYNIVPDGIIIGKSAGAGLVLGAFIGRKSIMDSLLPMGHIFTLSGNHLACSAGIAQLKYMRSSRFQKCLKRSISLCSDTVYSIQKKHPEIISFVRITGMSIGIGIKPYGKITSEEMVSRILSSCHNNGLLILSTVGTVLRIQPPLNISPHKLKKGFRILETVIEELKGDPALEK